MAPGFQCCQACTPTTPLSVKGQLKITLFWRGCGWAGGRGWLGSPPPSWNATGGASAGPGIPMGVFRGGGSLDGRGSSSSPFYREPLPDPTRRRGVQSIEKECVGVQPPASQQCIFCWPVWGGGIALRICEIPGMDHGARSTEVHGGARRCMESVVKKLSWSLGCPHCSPLPCIFQSAEHVLSHLCPTCTYDHMCTPCTGQKCASSASSR